MKQTYRYNATRDIDIRCEIKQNNLSLGVYHHRSILFLACSLVALFATAQTTFQRTLDVYPNASATSNDFIYFIKQTTDGGYILSGETNATSASWIDMFIIKTTSDGDVTWRSLTNDSRNLSEIGRIVQPTTDGGYIVIGTANARWTPSGGCDYQSYGLWKYDGSGALAWQNTYGGVGCALSCTDFVEGGQQTYDGGYIMAGYGNGCFPEPHLIKTDGTGAVQWDKSYGLASFSGNVTVGGMQQTDDDTDGLKDDGYIVLGSYIPAFAQPSNLYLLKTDVTGATVTWCNSYSVPGTGLTVNSASAIQQTTDGGFIVAGNATIAGNADAFLMKTNSTGAVSWANQYGGTGTDKAIEVSLTSDGGYIVAGTYGLAAMLMKVDAAGSLVWAKNVTAWYQFQSAKQTADGGYITAGESTNASPKNSVIMKTDASGNTSDDCATVTNITPSVTSVTVTAAAKSTSVTAPTSGIKNQQSVLASSSPTVCVVTPIELLSFTADPYQSNSVLCNWATASEINNDYFTLEKSVNDTNFSPFATIGGAGNSSITKSYQYIDNDPYMGLSYYRLKQTDFNGQFSYSNIDDVYLGGIEIIFIYPNPASDYIQYIVGSESGGTVTVNLYDALGREALSKVETIEIGVTTKKISTVSLAIGSYLLRITNGKHEKTQKQFVVK